MVDTLQIPLKDIQETQHKLLDILHTSPSAKVAIPVNEVLLEPDKTIWQTPDTVLPTAKRADKKYYVQLWVQNFYFPGLPLAS